MTTTAAVKPFAPVHWPGWYQWLRRELAPLSGRGVMTARMVAVNALITLVALSLQVPGLGVCAFIAFLFIRDNRAATLKLGLVAGLSVALACVFSLLLFQITFEYHELRVPCMALAIFTAIFLFRASRLGAAGWIIVFFVALTQGSGDLYPHGDQVVRSVLYLAASFLYSIAIAVLVNVVLLPPRPRDYLARGLRERLDLTANTLREMLRDGAVGGRDDEASRVLGTRDATALFGTLGAAEKEHPELAARHNALTAVIVASGQVARATGALEARARVSLSADDRRCAEALLTESARLREAAAELGAVPLPNLVDEEPAPTLPELRELQFAVASLHDSLSIEEPPDAEPPAGDNGGFFKPDAFSNPEYPHFAFKVALATMICYVVYTSMGWPGLSTAMITCNVMALEGANREAEWKKGFLRLAGCCAGGLFGFLSITFLVPYMTSVASLILLSGIVTAFGGWIAAGGKRLAYFGGQTVFCFYLGMDQGYAPPTSYVPMRDRFIGILLGLVVSTAVYANLWPERASLVARPALAEALRGLARLMAVTRPGAASVEDRREAERLRRDLPGQLENAVNLSEFAEEDGNEDDERLSPPIVALSQLAGVAGHAQAVFLLADVLTTRSELDDWERLPGTAREAEAALRDHAAEQLRRSADLLEHDQPAERCDLDAFLTAWERAAGQEQTSSYHARLLKRFTEQIGQLQRLQEGEA